MKTPMADIYTLLEATDYLRPAFRYVVADEPEEVYCGVAERVDQKLIGTGTEGINDDSVVK